LDLIPSVHKPSKDAALTLDTILDIARTEEVTTNQIKEISPSTSAHVDAHNHGIFEEWQKVQVPKVATLEPGEQQVQ